MPLVRETYIMESYSSEAARREWRRILNKVDHGESVEITRYGEPVAVVAPAGASVYLLERIGGNGYDEAAGFVVVAESTDAARQQAAEQAGDATWLTPSRSTCEVVKLSPGVVLCDFRAG
jgi:prevent-host-death family protein